MFSDRYLRLKIVLLLVFVAIACLYSQLSFDELTYQECLDNPARYDGALVPISLDVTLGKIEPERFWVHNQGDGFPVEVPGGTAPHNLREGDFFQATAIFHQLGNGGYLELDRIRTAPLRRLKIAVSVLPVLLVVVLLARWIRLEKWRLVVRDE